MIVSLLSTLIMDYMYLYKMVSLLITLIMDYVYLYKMDYVYLYKMVIFNVNDKMLLICT